MACDAQIFSNIVAIASQPEAAASVGDLQPAAVHLSTIGGACRVGELEIRLPFCPHRARFVARAPDGSAGSSSSQLEQRSLLSFQHKGGPFLRRDGWRQESENEHDNSKLTHGSYHRFFSVEQKSYRLFCRLGGPRLAALAHGIPFVGADAGKGL